MLFDPENPVNKLCAEGMEAEMTADIPKAKALFQQAWEMASSDFEKFTVAHYLARNPEDAKIGLHWNLESLRFALLCEDTGTKAHFASLYLNIGKSYEDLGNSAEALRYYELADKSSVHLPADPYGDMIRFGIRSAFQRIH